MIVVHSEVPVDPESIDDARTLLQDIAARSRAEEGVLSYHVTRDIEDPDTFRIVERYEDRAANEAHESSAHVQQFQAEMEPYLATDAELTVFEVTDSWTAAGP